MVHLETLPKGKKMKSYRKFLNPKILQFPGSITVDPYYVGKELNQISVCISDCRNQIRLEFRANDNYSELKDRKRDLENSIEKVKILRDAMIDVYEELLKVELKPLEISETNIIFEESKPVIKAKKKKKSTKTKT